MNHLHAKFLIAPLAALALILLGAPASPLAAEGTDYNSSRSNKSHAIAAPDEDGAGEAVGDAEASSDATPVRATMKGQASKGGGGGSPSGARSGYMKIEGVSGEDERLSDDRSISEEGIKPAATEGGEPQGMAINEKGMPGSVDTKDKKKSTAK